jgi:hypothetical protein
MSLQIYKPNSKNTGAACTVSLSQDQKTGAPVCYLSAIAQYSWDDSKKTGSFAGNAKNPQKTINVKINEIEAGDFLSCFTHRYEHTAFHAYDGSTTTIKVSPWDKSVKVSKYDPSSKGFKDENITVPAFGLTLSKGKGNSLKIALDPGEVENLKSFLSLFIQDSLRFKIEQNKKYSKSSQSNYNKKPDVAEEDDVDEFADAPF